MSHEEQKFVVIEDYKTNYPDSIAFACGEKVSVGGLFTEDSDWRDWVWCEKKTGEGAWVPLQYLSQDGKTGRLTVDYDARELSVTVGETLVVTTILNGFGMALNARGERGWVPLKVLEGV